MRILWQSLGAALVASLMLAACATQTSPQEQDKTGAQGAKSEAGASESPEATPSPASCVEVNPHPIGESIANKYEVDYEQVMAWFCEGEAFDDILLALETERLTDVPVEEIFKRANEVGWDQLWDELGLTEPPDSEGGA